MGTNERKKKKVKSKKRSNLQLSENGESFCFSFFLGSLFWIDEMINTVEEETEKNLPSEKKKRKREKGNAVDVSSAVQIKIEGGYCVDLLEFTLVRL
ncbi:hypothetical protein Pint_18874 [Pistacia integerrima]|uniref:Uncharacterized protein n=1 Tax=Pistacia integerrima TaxID=434235 RepID=A0ACC0YVT9_9ROSI|nr:hypothetical protein Pint_18874 [Pistacia integerrima]